MTKWQALHFCGKKNINNNIHIVMIENQTLKMIWNSILMVILRHISIRYWTFCLKSKYKKNNSNTADTHTHTRKTDIRTCAQTHAHQHTPTHTYTCKHALVNPEFYCTYNRTQRNVCILTVCLFVFFPFYFSELLKIVCTHLVSFL